MQWVVRVGPDHCPENQNVEITDGSVLCLKHASGVNLNVGVFEGFSTGNPQALVDSRTCTTGSRHPFEASAVVHRSAWRVKDARG